MNEWMNEWMNEYEWMNEWINLDFVTIWLCSMSKLERLGKLANHQH